MVKMKESKLQIDEGFHQAYREFINGNFVEAEAQMRKSLKLKSKSKTWQPPNLADL